MNSRSYWRSLLIAVIACIVLPQFNTHARNVKPEASSMRISSPVFQEGQRIPKEFTEDGKNISPPLSWTGAPANCQSFALICDDPDAPVGNWVHWVIYNLPGNSNALSADINKSQKLPDGTNQGKNSWGNTGYGGPAPPPGKVHRYFFKLYALDNTLSSNSPMSKEQLLTSIKGHVIAECQLIGTYSR